MRHDLSKIPDHILRAAFNPRRFAEGGPTFGGNDEDDDLDSYFGDLGSISSTPTNDSGEGGDVGSKPTETKTDTSTSSLGTKTTSAPDPKAVNASPVSTSSSVSFGREANPYHSIADSPEERLNNTEQALRGPTGPSAEPRIAPTSYGTNYQTAQMARAANPTLAGRYSDSDIASAFDTISGALPGEAAVNVNGNYGAMNDLARVGINQLNVGFSPRSVVGAYDTTGQRPGTASFAVAGPRSMGMAPSGSYNRDLGAIATREAFSNLGVSPEATDATNFVAAGTPMVKGVTPFGSPVNGTQFGKDFTGPAQRVAAFNSGDVADPSLDGPSEIPQPVSNPSAKEILQQLAAQNAPQGVNSLMAPPKPTPKPEQPTQLSGQLPDAPVTLAELMSQLDQLKSITARKGPAQEGFYAESNFTPPTYSRTNPNKIQDRGPAEEEERILEIENVPVEQSADGTNFSPESTLRKAEYAARNPAEYGMPGVPGADLATIPGMVRGISELASEIPSFDVNQLKAPAKQKVGLDLARIFGKDDDLIQKYGGKALTGTIKSGLDYLNGIKNDFAARFSSQSPSQFEAQPSTPAATSTQDEKSHLTKGADGEWSLDGDRVGFGVTRDMSPEDVVKTLEKEGYDPSQIDFGAPPTNQNAAPESAPEEDVPDVPSYTDGIYGIMGQRELHPKKDEWLDTPYPRMADGSYKTAADVSQDDMLSMKARRTDGVEAYTEQTPEEEQKRQNKYKVQSAIQRGANLATHGISKLMPDIVKTTREYDERPSWEQAYIKAQTQKRHPDFYNPDTRGTDSYIPDPDSPYFPIWLEEQQNAIWGRKWG